MLIIGSLLEDLLKCKMDKYMAALHFLLQGITSDTLSPVCNTGDLMDTASYSFLMVLKHVWHQRKTKLMLVDSLTSLEIMQMDKEMA